MCLAIQSYMFCIAILIFLYRSAHNWIMRNFAAEHFQNKEIRHTNFFNTVKKLIYYSKHY